MMALALVLWSLLVLEVPSILEERMLGWCEDCESEVPLLTMGFVLVMDGEDAPMDDSHGLMGVLDVALLSSMLLKNVVLMVDVLAAYSSLLVEVEMVHGIAAQVLVMEPLSGLMPLL